MCVILRQTKHTNPICVLCIHNTNNGGVIKVYYVQIPSWDGLDLVWIKKYSALINAILSTIAYFLS